MKRQFHPIWVSGIYNMLFCEFSIFIHFGHVCALAVLTIVHGAFDLFNIGLQRVKIAVEDF